jgi:carboxyl-terminal processing protease
MWMIFAATILSVVCHQRADRSPYGRWFAEVLDTIDRHYVEPVDDQKLFEGALDGMVRKLDDYSSFVPRRDATEFEETLDQEYGGIGVEVSLEGERKQLTIMAALPGTPAFRAGLLSGDKIVAIDGKSTQGLQLPEIIRMMRGRPGAEVVVSVNREGKEQSLDFRIVRARIQTDSVLGERRGPDGAWSYFLDGEDRIGYVRVAAFGKSTVEEFEAAMRWLAQRNCRGAIIDLRNNPGGLLDAAEQICDQFLPAGAVIVTTRGRDARERTRYEATGRGGYQDLPLVVLVNDKSASAAEIVAACLQDHQRATIVGERTWGKGTVQNVIPLEGGRSLLKLTIASYWRPSGKNIHRLSSSSDADEWGVSPSPGGELKLDDKQEVELAERLRNFEASHRGKKPASTGGPVSRIAIDPQLEKGVRILREKLAATVGA